MTRPVRGSRSRADRPRTRSERAPRSRTEAARTERAPRPPRPSRRRDRQQQPAELASFTSRRAQRDALASQLGERPENLREIPSDWLNRLAQCAIVDVHTGRWRATTPLTLTDLGIDEDSLTEKQRVAYERTLKLGDLLLLPREEKKAVEQPDATARTRTRQLTLSTRVGKVCRPENYLRWKGEMVRLRDEYLDAWDSVFERWDEIQNALRDEYVVIGQENYATLQARWQGTPSAFRERFGTRAAYVNAFVERIMRKIPPKEYARKLVRFDWEVGFVVRPTSIEHELAEAQRIRQDAVRAQAESDAAARRARLESDEIAERTRVRNAALLEMERDIAAEAANAKRKTLEVIQDLQTTLHAEIYNTLVDALEILKENRKLKSGTRAVPVGRLNTLIEFVQRLKFWDDPLLDANLAEIQELIDEDARHRDTRAIEGKVREVAAASKLVLLGFDEYADLRSSNRYGIPDDLPAVEAMVRRGRRADIGDVGFDAPELRRERRRAVAAL